MIEYLPEHYLAHSANYNVNLSIPATEPHCCRTFFAYVGGTQQSVHSSQHNTESFLPLLCFEELHLQLLLLPLWPSSSYFDCWHQLESGLWLTR